MRVAGRYADHGLAGLTDRQRCGRPGAGGGAGWGVSEWLTAFDLSWAVPVAVGGDSGFGDLVQGALVGCGQGGAGEARGGGSGADGGDVGCRQSGSDWTAVRAFAEF